MSKIGKKSIAIPQGVTLEISDSVAVAKGPKGELKKTLPTGIHVSIENGQASVSMNESEGGTGALWGLGRAIIASMIKGVAEGFERTLEFSGVGYKAQVKPASPAGGGDTIELSLGFTHPVVIKAPQAVTFQVEKNTIIVRGPDKESVGHVAALIRAARPPEPYKGSGVKYKEEIIRKKAGKKAAGATGTVA